MEALSSIQILRFHWNTRGHAEPLRPMTLSYADLTCLLSGEMTYFYEGQEILLKAGDAIFFPPGSCRVRAQGTSPVQYVSFNVLLPPDFPLPAAGHLSGCLTPEVSLLLDLFLSEWSANEPYAKERQGALFAYLLLHLTSASRQKRNAHVLAMQHYIQQNLTAPLSLSSIAETVHLAPEYCCSLFKKHTGRSIVTYIAEQRIDRAKRLFYQGSPSVREVAAAVGIPDAAYFSKLFSRHVGLSPRAYLRSLSEKKS